MRFIATALLCLNLIFSVYAADNIPIKPCKPNDLVCLNEAASEFVKNTAAGLPEYDCKPLDPMTLESMQFEEPKVKITISKIQISGMKGLKLVGFRLDETTKRTEFNMTMNLDVSQDVQLDFTEPKKTVSGHQTVKMNVECRTGYNWEIVKDETGEHYQIGPETTTCETLSTPEVTLDPQLLQQLQSDAVLNKEWTENKAAIEERRRKNLAKVAERAFAVMIGNFRNSAKKLSTSDYIKNE